ncbi:MAG: DMT family transporter [Alphaproteobacteria bacterium]
MFQSLQKKQALGWKVLSYACFAGIAALIRHLSTHGEDPLSPFELAFFELCFGAIFLGVAGFSSLKSARFILSSPLALTRAFFASIGIGLWCVSLKYIPFATLSVFKLLSPLLTVFAAHLFLKEHLKNGRLIALGLCLAGTCLLFFKHFQTVWSGNSFDLSYGWYTFVPLIALGALSASHLMAKQVLKQVESWAATLSMLVWGSLFLSIPTVLLGTFPTWNQLPWLGFLGLLSGFAYYALNRALQLADISYLMPLSIVRFVFGSLLGYVCFGETVSPVLVLAVGGIMLMTVWFLRYEDS